MMQQIQEMLILSALLINLAKAIIDLDCTVIDSDPASFTFGFPIFAQNGFGCVDKLGSSSCLTFFGSPPLVNTDSPDRATACFTDTGNANGPVVPKIKQFAIENCQATCAYCCIQTPPKCTDKNENIDCSKVTQAMCTDPIWQNFMAEECPATCSLCDFGNCKDLAVDCSADISICTNRNWEAFVKENCQRTCKLCDSIFTTTTTTTPTTTTTSTTTTTTTEPTTTTTEPTTTTSSTTTSTTTPTTTSTTTPTTTTTSATTTTTKAPQTTTTILIGEPQTTVTTPQPQPTTTTTAQQQQTTTTNQRTTTTVVPPTQTPTGPTIPCPNAVDSSASCPIWIKNNFCQSPYYTNADKEKYCAFSCQLCSSQTVSTITTTQRTTPFVSCATAIDSGSNCAAWYDFAIILRCYVCPCIWQISY
ncbi:hypothetical protein WR25_04759 isoform C [Diploscapter pachys]|uniref:ShKT domain-containing protein n=1 Tax=Diploscapter pachys TaxID=2018661 RepID=A0A2A2KRT5_9BILA|nr:hypothetical protein WR25_04759 isoform B [Diploscapter pachys]PAV76620.1 hypothetical protein WR25_04759 isoform C [Diploscapter pachys]